MKFLLQYHFDYDSIFLWKLTSARNVAMSGYRELKNQKRAQNARTGIGINNP
jgi:hypothetical protein